MYDKHSLVLILTFVSILIIITFLQYHALINTSYFLIRFNSFGNIRESVVLDVFHWEGGNRFCPKGLQNNSVYLE